MFEAIRRDTVHVYKTSVRNSAETKKEIVLLYIPNRGPLFASMSLVLVGETESGS